MATAAAVVGAVVGVAGAARSRNAQKDAARDLRNANIESATQLAEAGRQAEADILLAQNNALESINFGTGRAVENIEPFVAPGQEAFRQAQSQILSGADIGGAIGGSISGAAQQGANPGIFDLSGPVGAESQRQSQLAVSGATPIFNQGLLTSGLQGLAATSDIAGLQQRGFDRTGDILGGAGAGRASVLIGGVPQLTQLAAGADEARLIGDVAGQQFTTSAAEQLGRLAGRVS